MDEALERVGFNLDAAKMTAEPSGGMRKRAGLARALALHVDEPSGGLDRIDPTISGHIPHFTW